MGWALWTLAVLPHQQTAPINFHVIQGGNSILSLLCSVEFNYGAALEW